MPQEPHGGPHPALRQITAQHPPQLPDGDPAPKPLHGLPDEHTSLGDTEVEPTTGVPERQQHLLGLSLFGSQQLQVDHLAQRFGGWAGRVLPPFFVYR
ncbi:hypothetical protein [Streptomyces anulatus]|uniref:hypothetical protein n=1 Tax=Streptomyces anulatus TaxID=1892 RepID=UPI00342D6E7F